MKNKSYKALLISILVTIIATPTITAANEKVTFPPQVYKMVLEARKNLETIDMDGFRKVVDNPPGGALIIDVREPDEYRTGHVPGAINVPRGLIEFKIWKYLGFPDNTDYDRKMYLYCKTGGRCTLAAKSLQDLGLTNVTVVLMKIMNWQKAGNPVVK